MATLQKSNAVNIEQKIWAAISYVWILSLISLLARKNDGYIRFHANQGILLLALSLFVWFPVVGWMLGILIGVLSIIGIIQAFMGVRWELPVIGKWAPKFAEWVIKTLKV